MVPIIAGEGFKYIYEINTLLDVLLLAIIICVTFAGGVWMFSMNEYEKNLIKAPLSKCIIKIKI